MRVLGDREQNLSLGREKAKLECWEKEGKIRVVEDRVQVRVLLDRELNSSVGRESAK